MSTRVSVLMASLLISAASVISCNNAKSPANGAAENDKKALPDMKEETVTFTAGNTTSKSFVVYDGNKQGKRPAVLVIPEWWGLVDYARNRARKLADLGYIAMAVDMYGNGKTADNPKEAMALASPFYKNPELTKVFVDAAIKKLETYNQADTANIAAIGYCYGGFVVLNAAKLGADLKGAVSFHGNLSGVAPNKDLLKAKVLVCHGAADKFVSEQEVSAFKKSMDSVGADYTFKVYANATHAFTNPEATANGKKFNMPIEYNAAADTSSWNDMKVFFGKIFTSH